MNVRVLERANIELPSNTAMAAVAADPAANFETASNVSNQSPTPMSIGQQSVSPTLQMSPPQSAGMEQAMIDGLTSSPPKDKKDGGARVGGTAQRGFVAALKDGFGFIETLQHDKEIFFHFSHVEVSFL